MDPYSVRNQYQNQNQRNWAGSRVNMPYGHRQREEQKQDDGHFAEDPPAFDVSTVDIEEIKRWAQMYMASSGAQPSYQCPFSQLVDRLSGKFPKLRAVDNWESFLIQHCLLSVAKTADGQMVQLEVVKKEKRRNKKKDKKGKQTMNSSKPERSPNAQLECNESNGPRKIANQSNGPSSTQTLHPVLQHLSSPKRTPQKANASKTAITSKSNEPSYVNAAKRETARPTKVESIDKISCRVPNVYAQRAAESLTKTEAVTAHKSAPSLSTVNPLISKPPLRANPVVIGHVTYMNSKKKAPKQEVDLPTTPESPTDDELSSVPTSAFPTPNVRHKKSLSHTPSPLTKSMIEEKAAETVSEETHYELKVSELTPNATTNDTKDRGIGIEEDMMMENGDDNEIENGMNDAVSATTENVNMTPDQTSVLFVQEHLQEILMKSYIALGTPQCRYVVLHELEREMKNLFRDTTPHELDPTDLNYVNFMQLLMMEGTKWDTISLEIVHCDRKLICKKRGEEFVPKSTRIKKHGREFDPCPEVETYVVITDRSGNEQGDVVKGAEDVKGSKGGGDAVDSKLNDDEDDDVHNGDGAGTGTVSVGVEDGGDAVDTVDAVDAVNGDDDSKMEKSKRNEHELDDRIEESIAHLARCNVVQRMTATDIYWHIKLIHSECAIRMLEAEFSGHHGQMPMLNSFDEIATALRRDGITGPRMLEMKWSDWERLHDLYRFDRDHQDFIDELVEDFFFPFLTAELLSNELAASGKNKFARQCMFDSERVRPKLTLCVDYGLFAPGYPILHYLVKLADFEDCERLLRLHTNMSVDEVMGEYSAMHIAAWRGKFKLLSAMTRYGGDPLKVNGQGETALEAGAKHERKLAWYKSEFPQLQSK